MTKLRFIIFFILLFANPVIAVELGQLQVDSYLNEPLTASLEINDIDSLDLADIKFSVASQSEYRKLLDTARPAYLDNLLFKITANTGDSHLLQITSRQRVIEPILDLLLKVSEKQSSFIKKFTLLMDPKFEPTTSQVIQAKSTSTNTTTVFNENETIESSPAKFTGRQTIKVKNRSISLIAQNSKLHDQYSVYQIMRAFYLENPQFFEKGNIDKLISGSTLMVPTESLIAEVPRQKAVNFVYSKSKDYPDKTTKGSLQARQDADDSTSTIPVIEKPLSIKKGPSSNLSPVREASLEVAKPVGVNPSIQTMQDDLNSWRSMATEFSSISDLIESQNRAIQNQNSALLSMSTDINKHEQQILQLDLRINKLLSSDQAVLASNLETTPAAGRVISDQNRIIEKQKYSIESINEQLKNQNIELTRLKSQLITLNEINNARLIQPLPEKDKKPQPEAISANAAPRIITYVDPETTSSTKLWFVLIMIVAGLIFALREWIWQRRFKTLIQRPVNNSKTLPEEKKPSTYIPSTEDTGEIELKDLDVAKKHSRKSDGILGQSHLQLESHSIEEVKIEIDVLLAYEQYSEAMQLVNASRTNFGDNPWLDIKELEILASSRQCDDFFALFNQKSISLEQELPIPWEKIEKMRQQLCKEFKISAVR